MISRYLVIALALAAGVIRVTQAAWVEAVGLFGLGAGLLVLLWARTRPSVKPAAWFAFGVTLVSMTVVLIRLRHG